MITMERRGPGLGIRPGDDPVVERRHVRMSLHWRGIPVLTLCAEAEQVDPGQPPPCGVRQQRHWPAVSLPLALLHSRSHVVHVPARSHFALRKTRVGRHRRTHLRLTSSSTAILAQQLTGSGANTA